MAVGVPNARVTCKRCEGSLFDDFSSLRKHQWAEHPEIFKNARRAAKKRAQAGLHNLRKQHLRKQAQATTALVKYALKHAPNGNGDMLVSELLAELKDQQEFLNDAMGMIVSIVASRKERK